MYVKTDMHFLKNKMQNLYDFLDISFLRQLLKSYLSPTQIIPNPAGIHVYLFLFIFFCFWLRGISMTRKKNWEALF